MPYPKCCWIVCLFLIVLPTQAQDIALPNRLVVAWVENDAVYARVGGGEVRSSVTGMDVADIILSPDGQHLAFSTRSADALSLELWLVRLDGSDPVPLVTQAALDPAATAPAHITRVVWLDAMNILFNTIRRTSFDTPLLDEVWRADIRSGEVSLLLPSDAAGQITISPDRQHIAVVSAGIYDQTDGRISLLTIETGEMRELFTFPAVSTASQYDFYPGLFWEADSTALRLAVPDKDLIYSEGEGRPVALWRLPVEGEPSQIGSVSASFFGLPQWSDDAAYLVYLERIGGNAGNRFDLVLAAGDGSNSTVIASGQAGTISASTWIPGTHQFIFAQDEPGNYRFASTDTAPHTLREPVFSPRVLPSGIVYANTDAAPFELRYLRLDDLTPLPIATVNHPHLLYDAILLDDE